MKIYTKTGDKGSTSLYGGTRILKSHDRIASYGNTDELNSFIGLLMSYIPESDQLTLLTGVQNQLFVIGSHLAAGNDHDFKLPEIKESFSTDLEDAIDNMNKVLPALKHFVLPGGDRAVSYAHVCRTVTRRAERSVVALSQEENVPDSIIIFLNRLSDYFFVLSRYIAHDKGIEQTKWLG